MKSEGNKQAYSNSMAQGLYDQGHKTLRLVMLILIFYLIAQTGFVKQVVPAAPFRIKIGMAIALHPITHTSRLEAGPVEWTFDTYPIGGMKFLLPAESRGRGNEHRISIFGH